MKKNVNTQIQKVQCIPGKGNVKETTSRHIIMHLHRFSDKEKIIKVAREKRHVRYTETKIRTGSPQKECMQEDNGAIVIKY